MRSLLFVPCFALIALTGLPRAARTQIIVDPPSPANSTVPAMISIVGHDASGVPDPIGQFDVIHRDLANNPVAGALIVVDFSGITELHLCSDDGDPNVTVDCGARTVRRVTDANGRATFRIMGWSNATPGSAGTLANGGRIYADGVLLASPSVSIYDLTSQGVGTADLSAALGDLFGGHNPARADYDASGSLGASDLSMWLKVYFAGGSTLNCSGTCP